MARLRKPGQVLILIGAATLLAAVSLAALRVFELETSELEHEGEFTTIAAAAAAPTATAISVRLTATTLRAGDDALFELCSQDALDEARWADTVDLAILSHSPLELQLRVPLTKERLAHAQRSQGQGACLLLGRGEVEHSGLYSVEVAYSADSPPPAAIAHVPVRARILARAPLSGWDHAFVGLIAAAVLVLLIGTFLVSGRGDRPRRPVRPVPGLLAAGLIFGAAQLPLYGATLGLLKGILLAALEIAFALVLTWGPDTNLGIHRTRRPLLSLALSVVAALLVYLQAKLWLGLIPSTGIAPIETFISWPSGMLAFASMAMIVPLAEELFFRGALWRSLERHGTAAAALGTLLVFMLMHIQQTWGNWGSLASVTGTGLVLTLLRAGSGSVLLPALTHALYNALLSFSSLL